MRFLTSGQKALLGSQGFKANLLVTVWFGEGPFYLCDDVEDLTDGVETWIGASALVSATEIKGASTLAAEPVTLTLDGTRMYNNGIEDPQAIFQAFAEANYHQKRVDIAYAFTPFDTQTIELITPVYAGKINHIRLVDAGTSLNAESPSFSSLEITLDSLAARYNRATFRTRSHEDQLEIAPGDKFFQFTLAAVQGERTLYWGKAGPGQTATAPVTGGWIQRLQHQAATGGG